MKPRTRFTLALCALSAFAIVAQALSLVDLAAFAHGHADLFAGLSLLAFAGEIDMGDLAPAFREFATRATEKIAAAEKKAADALAKHAELQANVRELEQKMADGHQGGPAGPAPAQSTGALVLKSAEADLASLRDGRTKSLRVAVPGFAIGTKAVTVTTGMVPSQARRDGEWYGPMERRTAVRDLLRTITTTQSSIEFLKMTRTGSPAPQVAEGDAKAQMDVSGTVTTAQVITIAAWIALSRQVLDDTAALGDYIDLELRDALQISEDAQLLFGSGTTGNIKGLWTQATALNRTLTGSTGMDKLRLAITQVQLARGVPTGAIVSPEGLEALELIKTTDGAYLMPFTVTLENGRTVVWRVPTVVTDALTGAQFMVGDFSRAARLWDRQQATVEISREHADFFTRNLVAVLAEERLTLTVPRGDLLVKGTLDGTAIG
jgi:HK97 family phage major capsid protein